MSKELITTYLGMELSSPIVVGACPLTIEPEQVRQMVGAGAGAIVLPSILQEQVVYAMLKEVDPVAAIQQSGYQPQQDRYNGGSENYLKTIRQLKQCCSIPLIASINGATLGPWLDYSEEIQDAGADALELNWQRGIHDPNESADQVEAKLLDLAGYLCNHLSIPIAVKLNQQFTNLASIAHKLQNVGVDGLVLFSHRPHWDVNIDRMHWTIRWELSPVDHLGTILEGIVHARTGGLDLAIAASGGIRTGEDAIKAMIAGADTVMVTSEVYREGPDAISSILQGISHYLDHSHHESLLSFQQSRPTVELTPERLMRLEYVDPLTRTGHYYDPTPQASTATGDSFGHRR
ncbi:dihydroorotate dehydrogenase-like protein [Aporhodopirellula aestuarii]|uniref:Dihydroorotate dehydrogenase-like protein n=1 Tax=Aporhodopirellula aestuarii TaxID=2950107 RepID=A0ABT0U000_9BACT|nr:dihydroorotate dehydrogenase-like protein [Aporhodopirellula aestuarii]MCM2370189.1 dihydroorotate dehydrogenase-like protein [Aporhodopirellula aestuarii]